MKSIFQNKWAVIGFAAICAFLWGSAFPVLKISNIELQIASDDTIAQIVFAGIRFLLAGLILLVFLLFTNRKRLKDQTFTYFHCDSLWIHPNCSAILFLL